MHAERLQKQIHFIVEIDKLKNVLRKSFITDASRRENDAEHSWHICVMVLLLSEYANNNNIDILRILKMLLIHDLVEIETGDIPVYDREKRKAQSALEKSAARALFSRLPDDQRDEFLSLWTEFEAFETDESRFARVVDRLEPILLNHHTQGRTWKELQVTAKDVREVNGIIAQGSESLWDFVDSLIDDAVKRGYLR